MKKILIAIGLLLVMMVNMTGCAVLSTASYFMNQEAIVSPEGTTVTIGNVAVELMVSNDEVINPTHEVLAQKNDEYVMDHKIVPGISIGKYTYVENTGETPAYVRFRITLSEGSESFYELTFNDTDFNVEKIGEEYLVTSKTALEVGEIVGPGLKTVKIRADLTDVEWAGFLEKNPDNKLGITIAAEAIEAESFRNYKQAFKEFDKHR